MEHPQVQSVIAAVWNLAAGVTGVMGGVTSVGAVSLLVVVGLLPPLVMLFRWRASEQKRAVDHDILWPVTVAAARLLRLATAGGAGMPRGLALHERAAAAQ